MSSESLPLTLSLSNGEGKPKTNYIIYKGSCFTKERLNLYTTCWRCSLRKSSTRCKCYLLVHKETKMVTQRYEHSVECKEKMPEFIRNKFPHVRLNSNGSYTTFSQSRRNASTTSTTSSLTTTTTTSCPNGTSASHMPSEENKVGLTNTKKRAIVEEVLEDTQQENHQSYNIIMNEQLNLLLQNVKNLEEALRKHGLRVQEYQHENQRIMEQNKQLQQEKNHVIQEHQKLEKENFCVKEGHLKLTNQCSHIEEKNRLLIQEMDSLKETNRRLIDENHILLKENRSLHHVSVEHQQEAHSLNQQNKKLQQVNTQVIQENKDVVKEKYYLNQRHTECMQELDNMKDNNSRLIGKNNYLIHENRHLIHVLNTNQSKYCHS